MPPDLPAIFRRLVAEGRRGFLLGLDGRLAAPAAGYAVATGPEYARIEDAVAAARPGQSLGYWDGTVDVVEIFAGRATAELAARHRGQRAIHDFGAGVDLPIEQPPIPPAPTIGAAVGWAPWAEGVPPGDESSRPRNEP